MTRINETLSELLKSLEEKRGDDALMHAEALADELTSPRSTAYVDGFDGDFVFAALLGKPPEGDSQYFKADSDLLRARLCDFIRDGADSKDLAEIYSKYIASGIVTVGGSKPYFCGLAVPE